MDGPWPAPLPRRAAAALVDVALVGPTTAVWLDLLGAEGLSLVGVTPAVLAVLIAYGTLCEATLRGRTVGKALLGLRVVAPDEPGRPVGWGRAAMRNALRIVDGFPYVPPYLVGGLVAWVGRGERLGERLGDRAAGTRVVRR